MNTGPARGMRDFLPEDVRRRQYVIGVIADVYQRYGFEPLETPAVENIETLLGKYGEEGDKLIFKILKRGEGEETGQADLALRYDLTVPLARVMAEYRGKLPKFFKRYQIQPVWRADRPQKGRFREFYQCDVDSMGSTSATVETELLGAVSDVLKALGFSDFEIIINHRQVLAALLNMSSVDPARHGDALIAIDKFDKVGADGVAKELEVRGFDSEVRNRVTAWLGAAYPTYMASLFEKDFAHRPAEWAAFQNLEEIFKLSKLTSAGPHLRFTPALARGLSYYTGAIFEIKVKDLAGSLGGGGRYDDLVGMFSGETLPACGFSLGLERILVVMGERDMFPKSITAAPADVLVTVWDESTMSDHFRLAAELRQLGLRVELYPEFTKGLSKQLKYADQRGIPFAAIIGPDELLKEKVNVKNMKNGNQELHDRSAVADWLKANL